MGKIIGITGGIASGKSTVTNFLRKQGFQDENGRFNEQNSEIFWRKAA